MKVRKKTMTMDKDMMNEVDLDTLSTAAGGHPFEECFYDKALYRAGVSFANTIFGSDEFYVNGTQISKDLARTLRAESTKVWNERYASSGDLVGYLREWKGTMKNKYGLDWNGQLGTYKVQAW